MNSRSFPVLLSSDPKAGSVNLSADGSSFTVVLYEPIFFPINVKYVTCEVQGATIWNTSPNISSALNNDTFTYNDGTGDITLTIPKGLYDLAGFQNAIYTLINNVPAALPANQLFIFSGNAATQKVVIQFPSGTGSINWGLSTVRSILGFEITSPTTAPAGQTITAPNVAGFNQTTSFLLHCDIVRNGIPVNTIYDSICANVFIDVLPGSLINYQPQAPVQIDCSHLIGARISTLNCRLTNQDNVISDTNGEYYTFMLIFRYSS